MELIGKTLANYRVERQLGRGGMATVYLAYDRKHDREVALKVIRPEIAAGLVRERFLREIQIASRLTHPHILPLFDSGVAHGRLYYTMPYIRGESLRDRLEREERIPIDEALRLGRDIASALGYAHQAGIVHRDVKPANILIAEGIPLVMDFGVALAVRDQETACLTQTGMAVGTPRYMSPEQISGDVPVDARADLYSLGCVVFEMLAGRPPFAGSSLHVLHHQVLAEKPPSIRELRPEVPGGVAAALERVLAKSPDERFRTATKFAEALVLGGMDAPTPPAVPARSMVPNNLPRPRTSFVGRGRELAECSGYLADGRLLTLIGVGGSGKTRLALRLAESQLERFDGVWFVDLAPIQDEVRVVEAVAVTLGVRAEEGGALLPALARHLADRRALLILDNCEHLAGATAALIDTLLTATRELTFLVTSREILGVEGERSYALGPLGVPDPRAERDLEAVADCDSARLFIDRARLTDPGFALTASSAPAVADICRRLDGIPLAIELAAAQIRVLSVEQIRSKLGDRFRLLTATARTPGRHQTLRATIQWSYDHLVPEEQHLFRILSVFSGGWSLEGASAVSGSRTDEFDVLHRLTALADKSLVVVQREPRSEVRYRMLETVREYALERLREAGEEEDARTQHLEFYLALAETADPMLVGPDQGEWLSKLDREVENLLGALARCERADEGATRALRIAGAVRNYWISRGPFDLGLRVTLAALALPGAERRTDARALALSTGGWLAYFVGRYAQARSLGEESLALAKELRSTKGMARALSQLGSIAGAEGRSEASRRYFQEAVALQRELGGRYGLALALIDLAELTRAEGDLDGAAPLYEEAMRLGREIKNKETIALALGNLAMVAVARGDTKPVPGMLLESLSLVEEIRSSRLRLTLFDASAGTAVFLGLPLLGIRFCGVSEGERERMGGRRERADEVFLAPWIRLARDTIGEHAYAESMDSGRSLGMEAAVLELRAWLESVASVSVLPGVAGGERSPRP